MSAEGAGMGPDGERLPDGFSYEDFLSATADAPAPGAPEDTLGPDPLAPNEADLPTDGDGCVELATIRAVELPAFLARLQEAGFAPHVEMPEGEPFETATASVFVPRPRLAEARRISGIIT